MKKIKRYIAGVAAITLLMGCTDKFEDFNKNPYGPTSQDLLGDNVETGILIQAMIPAIVQGQQNNSQMIDQMVGLEYGGHAAMINPWQGTNFYTYNPSIGWSGIPFDTAMPQIYSNFFQIKDKTGGKGVVFAWAQLLRVAASLKISDCYGPLPYSKINGTDYTVSYDNMEELYTAMFTDLDAAIVTLEAALSSGANVSSLKDFDYVYMGDFKKWVKYANSLKLRMAIRIANTSASGLAQQKAEEAVSDIIGVMTEAGDAAYSTFNDGLNPFYRAGNIWPGSTGIGEFRATASLTSYMNGYQDPRLSFYFEKDADGNYKGVRNGINQGIGGSYTASQKYSKVKVSESEPLLIMSAAEVCFLRAEGKLKGWDMGEGKSAKEWYEEGVRVSMAEKGATIGDYLSSTRKPADYEDGANAHKAMTEVCVKWNEDASAKEENLERIIIQKWIATYPSGWETWADIRRTGYPKLFPIVDNLNSGVINTNRGMRRLPFPQSEYNTNKVNIDAAAAMLGGPDNGATDLWWAKKQ